MRRLLCGPPNWIVDRLSSEARRVIGFWTIILSIVALIPNFASETPVEIEAETEAE